MPSISHSRRIVTGLWFLGAALVCWRAGYTVMQASDLWWHLASGRWIVEHGGLPAGDPWSFTAEHASWIVDAWLSDVILHAVSQTFGVEALVWWKWLVVVSTFLVLMAMLRRLCEDPLTAFLTTLIAAMLAAPFLDIRPHLHSLLLYAVFLACTVGRRRLPWTLVPLFGLWVNLHAGFSLGLLTLPIVAVPTLLEPAERSRALAVIVACFAVCLVNPNGLLAYTQPLLYALQADSPFRGIGEWQPPFAAGGIQAPLYPYGIALFLGSTARHWIRTRPGRDPAFWVALGLGALGLAMSLRSRRFIPVFAISQTLVVATAWSPLVKRATARIPALVSPVAAIALGALLLWPFPQRSYAFHHLTAEHTLPIETLDFVEANGLHGRLFAWYPWGGYVHLRTDGRLPVFIDGRASAVYSEETYARYIEVLNRAPGWMRVVQSSGADFFLWPMQQSAQIEALVASGKWRELYRDYVSVLLVRSDVRFPSALRDTPPSAGKDVALGRRAFEAGDFAKALALFERALQRAPTDARACQSVVRTLSALGREPLAEAKRLDCDRVFPRPRPLGATPQ